MSVLDRIRRSLGLHPGDRHSDGRGWAHDNLQLPEGLPEQLHTVEQAALDIYRRHNLPTQPASYVRRGPDAPWEILPQSLTPQQKWSLIASAPKGAGWRYGDRSVLGRHSPHEEVRNAATLIATCDNLRRRLKGEGPVTAQDIADAMLLGTAAGVLLSAQNRSTAEVQPSRAPLSFHAVEERDKR